MKQKIFSLLVLLMAAVSGAWAQTVIGNGWSDDFEGATCKWDLINGSAANKWTLGTATNNGGTQAIYISNDGGTTNTYVSGTGYASTVYAAKLFTFANDEYTFSYDWKANGENNYDYLRVALVPSSVTLTAKATSTDHKSTLPTGWIALDGGSRLKKETDWQNKSVTIDVSAGDYYLVFEWINDASTSDDPPAAIDNVSITPSSASSAPVVTFALAAAANEHGTVTFTVNSNEVTEAGEGDLVTVTITPDEGWIVDATSVKAESYTTWDAAGARRRSGAPANITILGDITLTKSTTAENTWTFTMPAASVLVSATYIPVAAFAPAEPSGTLAPTAAEGVVAGEDKAIIVAGTVANIPETTNPQGTVKYIVTDNKDMTAEQAAKANGWVETLPTAAGYTGSYADDFQVYVWYYIQAATGYADSKPQRIEVTVQSNLFDLTLKAANANTIDATQASKGTVTVGGTDKTSAIAEGKLKAVKMGSEVKLKANNGYKFRKVEVKKTGSAVLAPALENGATVVIICNWGYATTTFTYTNNGGTFSGQASGYEAEYFYNGLELNGKNLSFSASNVDNSEYLSVGITFNTESSAYSYTGKGQDFVSFTISVNGTDVTSQLSEAK